MATIYELTGDGTASHRGGGADLSGTVQFQLVGSDTGRGVLNVVIRRKLRGPWVNSIAMADVKAVEHDGRTLRLRYSQAGVLEIASAVAAQLAARIREQVALVNTVPPQATSVPRLIPANSHEGGNPALPSHSAESRHFVGDDGRFHRLYSSFKSDEVVQQAVAHTKALGAPPEVIDDVLQAQAAAYVDGMKPEPAAAFGRAYYTCMRSGWSIGEAVLANRGVGQPLLTPDDDDWELRLAETANRWFDDDPSDDLSDFCYYMVDNLEPNVSSLVADALREAQRGAELPTGWEDTEMGSALLDKGRSALLFGVAVAASVAGVEGI